MTMIKFLFALALLSNLLFASNPNLNKLDPHIVIEYVKKQLEASGAKFHNGIQIQDLKVLESKRVDYLIVDSKMIFEFKVSEYFYDSKINDVVFSKRDLFVLADNINIDKALASLKNPIGLLYDAYEIHNFKEALENINKNHEFKTNNLSQCDQVYFNKLKRNKRLAILLDYSNQTRCLIGSPDFELSKIEKGSYYEEKH